MRLSIGGKSILSGEYSLLYDGEGVSCCFQENIRFHMQWTKDLEKDAKISSDKYGSIDFYFHEQVPKEFHLFKEILIALNLPKVSIDVKSTSIFRGGFGTSGACIVAMVLFSMNANKTTSFLPKTLENSLCNINTVTNDRLKDDAFKDSLLKNSVTLLRTFHKNASGIDMATEIYGGPILYNPKTITAKKLPQSLLDLYDIYAIDCGYKTSTSQCLRTIDNKINQAEKMKIIASIKACTENLKKAFETFDVPLFEHALNTNNQLLESLGVCDDTMSNIITHLKKSNANVVKISGSGLGGCILAFFEKNHVPTFQKDPKFLHIYTYKKLRINPLGIFLTDPPIHSNRNEAL